MASSLGRPVSNLMLQSGFLISKWLKSRLSSNTVHLLLLLLSNLQFESCL